MTDTKDIVHQEKERAFFFEVDKIELHKKDCQAGLHKAIVAAMPYKFLFFIIATVDVHNCLHILDINNLEVHALKLESPKILEEIKREFKTNLEISRKSSHQDEAWAIEMGRYLFNKLFETLVDKKQILEALKRGPEWVWIYCDDYFDSIWWEWLYTTRKTPSNTETSDVASHETTDYQTEDGFFWGDKYNIIRLSKTCSLENPSAQCINNSAFITDKERGVHRMQDVNFLGRVSNNPPVTIKLDRFFLNKLSPCECIHFSSASEKFLGMVRRIRTKKQFPVKLLFLNICGDSKRDPLVNDSLKLINESIAAEVWIHNGFDVPDIFAHEIVRCFYEALANEKDVAKAMTTARNRIKTMNQDKGFWRLAYVATGNPCTKVTMDEV